MKICFLAPADSLHTIKWCRWFSGHGHEVHVISFTKGQIDHVKVYVMESGADTGGSDIGKLRYLLYAGKIRRLVRQINPDIVNAHYATSYGTVAALSGIKNYVLSVWGSDVYEFPQKSVLHKCMLKYSLSKARYIFSTSRAMAEETRRYVSKRIYITPFGVDMELFTPERRVRRIDDESEFIVGTVKALEEKYGIDYLLRAVSIVKKKWPEIPIKLRIAGEGKKRDEYKKLAHRLGIGGITTWLGRISQSEAAEEWANMDVGVIPSTDAESFGVAAVEAESCSVPLIVSDIPGLMESTKPGKTSIAVERKNAHALAAAIAALYRDPQMRIQMGRNGRIYAANHFEYEKCFKKIEYLYHTVIDISGK